MLKALVLRNIVVRASVLQSADPSLSPLDRSVLNIRRSIQCLTVSLIHC